jgi:nucleoside-diphosphate-sugar epimerase
MPVEVSTKVEDFRPKRGALDVSKAKRLVGYAPQYTLERGVAEYLAFLTGLPSEPPTLAAPLA